MPTGSQMGVDLFGLEPADLVLVQRRAPAPHGRRLLVQTLMQHDRVDEL